MVAPFLGSAAVPPRIKVGLAFLLTVFLVPLVPAPPPALRPAARMCSCCGEFAIGFLLGLTLQLIFEAGPDGRAGLRRADGIFAGERRQSRQQPGGFGRALDVLRTDCASALHSAERAALAVARTGAQFRLSSAGPLFADRGRQCIALFKFSAGMFVAGLQIAAPVLVASLFADVALGFIGKASPQLPVLFVGISLKNLLGLALLCGAVAYWPRFFDARFGRALEASERILQLAH